MAYEIDKSIVQKFGGDVLHDLNQEGSKLRGLVRVEQFVGDRMYFERLGRGKVRKITSSRGDTEFSEVAHARRRVIPEPYEWAELVPEEKVRRVLDNYAAEYAQACAMDLGVHIDKVIIDALNGNSDSMDASLSATQIALPASSIVDEDFGSANSNLTLAKLLEAKRKLLGHGGHIPGEISVASNADALMSLINDEKTIVGSIDYNNAKAVLEGSLSRLAGMNFIVLADADGEGNSILPGTADGTDTDPVRLFAFLKRSVGLGLSSDVRVRMDIRPDKRHAMQIRGTIDLGATRIEEEGVVAIECVQL